MACRAQVDGGTSSAWPHQREILVVYRVQKMKQNLIHDIWDQLAQSLPWVVTFDRLPPSVAEPPSGLTPKKHIARFD